MELTTILNIVVASLVVLMYVELYVRSRKIAELKKHIKRHATKGKDNG